MIHSRTTALLAAPDRRDINATEDEASDRRTPALPEELPMIRNTLLAAAAVLALMAGAAMAQSADQDTDQHQAPNWANAHDTNYGYNNYPR